MSERLQGFSLGRAGRLDGYYLQQLGVLPAELLQQSWEQGGIPLDGLSHVHKLGLSTQERQRVLSWRHAGRKKKKLYFRPLLFTTERIVKDDIRGESEAFW